MKINKENLELVNREVNSCPDTVFDQFDLSIDLKNSGGQLRDELVKLTNLCGNINKLASNAAFLYEKAKTRCDQAEILAWEVVSSDEEYKKMKITAQRKLIQTIIIEIDGEKTTLMNENDKLNIYLYLYNRGKDKVKEIGSILDVGRTLLSWDKNEINKGTY